MEGKKSNLTITIFQWLIVLMSTFFLITSIILKSIFGIIFISVSIAIIFPPFDKFIYPKINNWLKLNHSKLKPNLFRFLFSIVFMLFGLIIAVTSFETPIPFKLDSSLANGEITTKNEILFSGEVNDINSILKINNEVVDVKNSEYKKIYTLKTGLNKFNIIFKAENKEEESKEYLITHLTEEQLAVERGKKEIEEEKLKKIEEKAKIIAEKKLEVERKKRDVEEKENAKWKSASGNMWSNVKLYYGPKKMYVGQIICFDKKHNLYGKIINGVKIKSYSGSHEWKTREAVRTWYIKRDDPALKAMQYYECR